LEVDCEEEFYIEEELETEEEAQLGSNVEEELVTEEEEQLGSSEEEESEELASEKSAPKCKKFASPQAGYNGVKIDTIGKIGDIDFSKLNDSPNELDGFTLMTRNEGLEFPTKEKEGRAYYMYFGDLFNGRSANSLKDLGSYNNERDDWGRWLPDMNRTLSSLVNTGDYMAAQNFTVATVLARDPDQRDSVVTYYYNEGRITLGGQTGNGLVIAHGDREDGVSKFTAATMPLLKLYKNEKTHELIAYAAVLGPAPYEKDYIYGYVKIKMSLVNERKGRINVSMKFLKLSTKYSYTNFGYSVHMDIAGRHEKSKMYSLGNNEGLYFNEKNMKDGQDYFLYFYRNGYANHPAAMRASNEPTVHPFAGLFFYPMNGPGVPDPGKDVMYPYTSHPGWALRWEPKEQMGDTVREENLEITVSNRPDGPQEIQLDNDGEYTEHGYRMTGTWKNSEEDSDYVDLYYTVDGGEPKKMARYENPSLNTDVPWAYTIPKDEVEKGLDHDINVYAVAVIVLDNVEIQSNIETIKIRPALTITEQVFGEDGKVSTEVAPGETLNYEILVDSGYITEDIGTYGGVTITENYDPHLAPPTDLKVIDESGNEKGTATYNASTNTVEAKPYTDVPRSVKVKITFNAKVKEDAAEGEFVIGRATASGTYSTGDAVNQTSNEVKILIAGTLKFVSAPQVINFGEKLTISPRNRTYHAIKLDAPLAVKDSRALSRKPSWAMTAKLDRPLTGRKTGSTLDSLHYRYGGNVSILTEAASVQVYKKETINKQEVNISDTWNPDGDGLYLEVTAGTAKADAYEGTIRWVLQDVPLNE